MPRLPGVLSALMLILLAAGCAQPPPTAVRPEQLLEGPPVGQGRLYFYRSDAPFMVAVAPDVVVNGRKVGAMGYDQVFYRDARPGRYEVLLASDPDSPVYFTLGAGETRFVKAELNVGLGGARLSAELVEEEIARREIAYQRTRTDGRLERRTE